MEHLIEEATRRLPYPYPKRIRNQAEKLSFDFGPLDAQHEAQLRSQPSQRDLIQGFKKAFRLCIGRGAHNSIEYKLIDFSIDLWEYPSDIHLLLDAAHGVISKVFFISILYMTC